jgi:hypothetical protein
MTAASCSRALRKLKYALVFLLVPQISPAAPAEPEWHLLIEPTFMRHESAWPIVGSETAVLVPARYENGEVLPLKRNEVLELSVSRKDILESAPKAAAKVLETLKPEYVRDENQVIQYASIRSESPLTASAVLAPGFTKLFEETLGPEVLICIPNRFTVLVFPRESASTLNLSDLIFAEYSSSPYPVSREIFALQRGKLIAIGRYR